MADDLFWSRVDTTGECWIWRGYRNPQGYGRINRRGIYTLAHRYAWQEVRGPIPARMDVCHHCDNPPCVNPAHLFIGTRADNMQDAAAKGRVFHPQWAMRDRLPRGARHHWAKLRDADVLAIRDRHARGETQASLSREYGVSFHTITRIVHRTHWTHI